MNAGSKILIAEERIELRPLFENLSDEEGTSLTFMLFLQNLRESKKRLVEVGNIYFFYYEIPTTGFYGSFKGF